MCKKVCLYLFFYLFAIEGSWFTITSSDNDTAQLRIFTSKLRESREAIQNIHRELELVLQGNLKPEFVRVRDGESTFKSLLETEANVGATVAPDSLVLKVLTMYKFPLSGLKKYQK